MIDGLPTFFNTEKAHMRHNIAFVYPATFGGIPEYAVTAAAGIAHPMAGGSSSGRIRAAAQAQRPHRLSAPFETFCSAL